MEPADSLSESHQIAQARLSGELNGTSRWQLTETLRPYFKQIVRNQLGGNLSNKLDESDIVQAALVRAVDCLGEFEGKSEGEWKAWLAVICRNETKNAARYWRQQKRNVALEQGLSQPALLADQGTGVSGQFAKNQLTVQIFAAIDKLPIEQQQLIQWRNFEDLSHKEIAARLNITEATARQRWHATLLKLKNLMKQNDAID